ncbi:MAG: hypothetical protein AAGA72_18400 [Pseudomonadota bacterium]
MAPSMISPWVVKEDAPYLIAGTVPDGLRSAVLSAFKALGGATVGDAVAYLFHETSIQISYRSMGNIARKMKKQGMLTTAKGEGKKGDPIVFEVTQNGEEHMRAAAEDFKVVSAFISHSFSTEPERERSKIVYQSAEFHSLCPDGEKPGKAHAHV